MIKKKSQNQATVHNFQIVLHLQDGKLPTIVNLNKMGLYPYKGLPSGSEVKNPPTMQRCKRRWFHPWVWKIPWRRKWQPTPVFLLGKSLEQRSLAGYSLWGHKESNMTEVTKQQSSYII